MPYYKNSRKFDKLINKKINNYIKYLLIKKI